MIAVLIMFVVSSLWLQLIIFIIISPPPPQKKKNVTDTQFFCLQTGAHHADVSLFWSIGNQIHHLGVPLHVITVEY